MADVRERTILVERAASLGEIKATKTGASRSVRMLGPVLADLARWRLACGSPEMDKLVFPSSSGGVWSAGDYKNWRRRAFRAAVEAAHLPRTTRPYDLRHSFASMLIAEGRSVVDIAGQMGHAPTMTLDTYGHVIADMDGAERPEAGDAIKTVRGVRGRHSDGAGSALSRLSAECP